MAPLTLRPIDQLAKDWAATSRSLESQRALRMLAAAEKEVAQRGVSDLGGLVTSLRQAAGTAERVRAAQVVRAMLRSQDVHPLVARAILQSVVPGLVNVARRLAWGAGGDWDDGGAFFADLLTTTWELIVSWSGQDREYAVVDLLSAVRCRLRRQVISQRTARNRVDVGLSDDEEALGHGGIGPSDLEVLARTIDDLQGGELDVTDAAVIYANRVLGLTMTELARMSGHTRRQLDRRRTRAQRLLCA